MTKKDFLLYVKTREGKFLGVADSYGRAKDMLQGYYDKTDKELASRFGGLDTRALTCGYAKPVFYAEGY